MGSPFVQSLKCHNYVLGTMILFNLASRLGIQKVTGELMD